MTDKVKWKKDIDTLLNRYGKHTSNISFIGSPAPREDVALEDTTKFEKRFNRNDAVREYLKNKAAKYKGLAYHDVFDSSMMELDSNTHYPKGGHGRVHLNSKGYKKVYDEYIRDKIKLDLPDVEPIKKSEGFWDTAKVKKWQKSQIKTFDRIRNDYDKIITKEAERSGLSKAFLYGTIYTESRGKATVQGSEVFKKGVKEPWQKRAQGVAQVAFFLARDAAKEGVISKEDYDSGKWRFDPELNIKVAGYAIAGMKKQLLSDKRMGFMKKGKYVRETTTEAKKRTKLVNDMLKNKPGEFEDVLHIAYSHGPYHSLTKTAIYKGMNGIKRIHQRVKAKFKRLTKGYKNTRTDRARWRKDNSGKKWPRKNLAAYAYPRLTSQVAKDMLDATEQNNKK